MTRALAALVVVCLVAPVARAACVAWRTAGNVDCRDGDPTCDLDGIADGACTLGVAVCVSPAECDGGVRPRIRGAGAAGVRTALATLGAGGGCTGDVAVRVRLGRLARRRARLRALARSAAGAPERASVRLGCVAAARGGDGRAVVVTTDFETGLLATVGVRAPHAVARSATPIHSDAVVRVSGGRVFVVNRFLGDNLQVLDPAHGLTTTLQCSTGPGSNPHDVAVVGPHKAYVTRYDEPELWIVDPDAASCATFRHGAVDLSQYGDADGLPEMDQLAIVGDRAFVTLERLDRARRFAPSGRSRIAVLDTTTDAVVGVIDLTGANAFGDASGLVREPGTGKLVVAEGGDLLKVGDGGLERVDPETLHAEGFFVTEDALGGSVSDFVLVTPTKGYAIVLDAQLRNVLLEFDPSQGIVTRRLLTRTQYLPDVALAPDGTLWLADDGLPAPGIRIFDIGSDRQLTTAAIDVGLPPFSIGFLP